MTDLWHRLSELDQLEAPDMRADIELRVLQLRGSGSEQPPAAARDDVIVVDIGTLEPRRTGRGWPRYAIPAGAAAIAALVIIIALALFDSAGEESPTGVVDGPDVEAPEPTVPIGPDAPTPAADLEVPVPAPPITRIDGINTSAGSLWIWDQEQIWTHTDGTWTLFSDTFAPTIASLQNLAFDGDTLWALTDNGTVLFLDGDDWHSRPPLLPNPVRSFDTDPDTGVLWLSTGSDLYRWDGEELTNVGGPPNDAATVGYGGLIAEEILVTDDGSVWATGFNAWFLEGGGLARYDDTTNTWDLVRPAGGDEDLPAVALASAPDGDLWAILTDPHPDTGILANPCRCAYVLAHRDGASGEWTVHHEAFLGDFEFPLILIAADDDAVWLVRPREGIGADADDWERSEISGFDGETWTHHLSGTRITDMAISSDGVIWVVTDAGELRRVEP